jgi:hypothetical protein
MQDLTDGEFAFRGQSLWSKEYPATDSCPGSGRFLLAIYRVQSDTPIRLRTPRTDRAPGVGGYLLIIRCADSGESFFDLHYPTLTALKNAKDGRFHESVADVRAAIEDALGHLKN